MSQWLHENGTLAGVSGSFSPSARTHGLVCIWRGHFRKFQECAIGREGPSSDILTTRRPGKGDALDYVLATDLNVWMH